jgi:hypothetical protein
MSAIQRPQSRLRPLPHKVIPLKPSEKTLPVKDLRNSKMIFGLISKNDDGVAYINLMNKEAKAINQQHKAEPKAIKQQHNAEPKASSPKASSPKASKSKVPGTEASKSRASNSNSANAVIPKRLSNSKASNSNLARLSSPKAERKNKYLSILYRMNDMKNKYIQELKKNREIEKKRKIIKQRRALLLTHDDNIEEDFLVLELQKLLKPVHNIDGKYINGDSNM